MRKWESRNFSHCKKGSPEVNYFVMEAWVLWVLWVCRPVLKILTLFATLRFRGRPGRDGCQSPLSDCFGGHCYIHHKDDVIRFKNNSVEPF